MTDAGFFKGTSADQDSRFSDKNKKLMKTMKFAENIDKKIDMKKIRLELMRPHITSLLNALIPVEDDVMVEYVFSQLEEKQHPDGKLIQIMMTGFLGKTKARTFMFELWATLCEAQLSPHGVPALLIEQKREELMKKKAEDTKISAYLNKNKEEIERCLNIRDRQPLHARNEIAHQQVSIHKPKSPSRVGNEKSNNNDKERRSERDDTRRRKNRSRSRSPKHSYRRSSRSPHRKRTEESHRHETERKTSRRFREKTPDVEPEATAKMEVDKNMENLEIEKLKKDDEPMPIVDQPAEPTKKPKSHSNKSKPDSGSGSSSSSSGSDSDTSSDSSGSSSSSSDSDSDSDTSHSSSSSTQHSPVKKPKIEATKEAEQAAQVNGNETKEVAPLQRILEKEKRKEDGRSRDHRSSRDEEDRRRRREDEEERRRRDEDRRRRHEEERRRRDEEERRRRDEEERRRDEKRREERRREEERREERRREEERRLKEKEEQARSRRHEESDKEKKRSGHKKKKSSRDEDGHHAKKSSKKSKKSSDERSERREDDHKKSKEGLEIEKALREKALESLVSKRRRESESS